jgi:AcrR family transcriptional regulator
MSRQTTCRLRADARRETIIDAAIALFSEKGFRRATIRDLSAAVGVSEPVVYEHFRTKRELYEAIMDRMADAAIEELNSLMAPHLSVQDSRSFLLGLTRAMVAWFSNQPGFVRLLLSNALERESLSRRFHARLRKQLVEVLGAFMEGRIRADSGVTLDPEVVAHTFICMAAHHGLVQVLFDHQLAKSPEEVMEEMVDIFMHGVCK